MRALILTLVVSAVACGPSNRADNCVGDACRTGTCDPSETRDCYTGHMDTEGVGPCTGGTQMCLPSGVWGNCVGEVVPVGEVCGDNIDNNCNGMTDENVDADGDGYTTCGGDCCDSTNECSDPGKVNPGAFDAPGNGVDDDCNGVIDDTIALCDQNLTSDTTDAMDYAKAIDLCQTATMADLKWGVIDAALTLPDGTGVPDTSSHSIRHKFGTGTMPQGGLSFALLSSGVAASEGDMNPAYHDWVSYTSTKTSGFPADFLAANGGNLPNAPGCPSPSGAGANDPVMLTLHVRVPSNAHSFSIKSNFYSAEFPEFTCTAYNDFFIILLDSTYAGTPSNPADKNLAFYTQPNTTNQYPIGVNLAYGNTGLFTQCVNGATGCAGTHPGTISTCVGSSDLTGTGFDTVNSGECDGSSLEGGATGWLTTTGNVVPGEVITVRIAIWDTSDHLYDSLALVDAFTWSVDAANPGTVIGRTGENQVLNVSRQTGLATPNY